MPWLSQIQASRRGRILAVAVLIYLGWEVWLAIEAPRKIAPGLERTVSRRGTVDLVVALPFPPERFHILIFQRYGRVSGTSGNTAEVRGVKLKEVSALAHYYWVRRIQPTPDSPGAAPRG